MSHFACMMLLLLCILLLPRLLLLFPEKAADQLNLRGRTVLYVDSGSTFSSSCYVCQELHRRKSHSPCQQGQSCCNCRGEEKDLFFSIEISENVSFLPQAFSTMMVLFTSKKRCTGLAQPCSVHDWERMWDLPTSYCHQTHSKWGQQIQIPARMTLAL